MLRRIIHGYIAIFAWTKSSVVAYSLVSLKTSSTIQRVNKDKAFDLLSSPENWPRIVISSQSVTSQGGVDLSKPLPVGDSIDETIGLPPFLMFSLSWTCVASDAENGYLAYESMKGIQGIATDCKMTFVLDNGRPRECKETDTTVNLDISYKPDSLLGYLATPIVAVDNEVALKILLPFAMSNPLNQFRQLMAYLYLVAGMAHFGDCVFGSSQLLKMAGGVGFYDLPLTGQAYALLWCFAGPMAFAAFQTQKIADAGLVWYGFIEVVGAAFLYHWKEGVVAGTMDPFYNAVAVQVIVLLAWIYSWRKSAL